MNDPFSRHDGDTARPPPHLKAAPRSRDGIRDDLVRLQGVLDNFNELVVVVDRSNAVAYANSRVMDDLGCAPDQLIGRPFPDLLHPDDMEGVGEVIARQIRGDGTSACREARFQRVDAEPLRRYELRISPIRDGDEIRCACVIARRISAPKNSDRQLGDSDARSILESSADEIMLIDLQGCVRFVNRELGDTAVEQLVGTKIYDHVDAAYHEQIEKCLRQVWTTKKPGRYEVHRYTDAIRSYEASVTPVIRDGVVTALTVISREITDLYRMEDVEQRASLDRVDRIRAYHEMAIGIAHEINQPLGAIANFASACARLASEPDFDRQLLQQQLSRIQEAATRTGGIVRRLRSFVKNSSVQKTPADIHQIIDGALTLMVFDLDRYQVNQRVSRNDAKSEVMCDEIQIQQVLVNLIMNACEAIAESPHAQTPHTPRLIQIDTWTRDGHVEVVVSDSGPGVADSDDTEKLFDRFYTSKKDGMGIGLTISRSIIEAHGGRIWAENSGLGGAAFHFTLPSADVGPRR